MRLFIRKSIIALATFGLLGMMAALLWLSDAEVIDAQRVPPFIVEGRVILDGRPAEDGSTVIAYINGGNVGEAQVLSGTFVMAISERSGQHFTGRPVEFAGRVPFNRQEFDFPQQTIWRSGGHAKIKLQVLTGGKTRDNERPAPVEIQPPPPWVIKGKVMIEGRPAPDRTRINAFVRFPGAPRREHLAKAFTSGNAFVLSISQPPRRSLSGDPIKFEARLQNGRDFVSPQTFVWAPGKTSSITLRFPVGSQTGGPKEPSSPFGLPGIPSMTDGLDVGCLVRILGRIPAGPQDMSPSEMAKSMQCFGGGGSQDDPARLELEKLQIDNEKQRLEQELKFQLEQQRLDAAQRNREQERIKREQALQEEQDRLDRDRLKSERERRVEQARLDAERQRQDLDRLKADQEMQDEQQRLNQRRALEEQQRQDELERARFESERARIDLERTLEDERARLEQERLKRDDERFRREDNLNRQGPGGQPFEAIDPNQPPDGENVKSGPVRGFFTNTRVGGLGAANQFMDPTMLAVFGILITMAATLMQMVKGS